MCLQLCHSFVVQYNVCLSFKSFHMISSPKSYTCSKLVLCLCTYDVFCIYDLQGKTEQLTSLYFRPPTKNRTTRIIISEHYYSDFFNVSGTCWKAKKGKPKLDGTETQARYLSNLIIVEPQQRIHKAIKEYYQIRYSCGITYIQTYQQTIPYPETLFIQTFPTKSRIESTIQKNQRHAYCHVIRII